MSIDSATRSLAGKTIWNVAQWLEAHYAGEPYEMFSAFDDFGYRLTVERIPMQDLGDSKQGEDYSKEICRHCGHPVEQHCGHDMMCNHLAPDDSPEGGTYCNCWDSDA